MTNAQTEVPLNVRRMTRLARCAVRRLAIRASGTFAITFIDRRQMRALNRRFLGHDRVTDVLSFRYDGEPTVGEIFVAPRVARAYAKQHDLPYEHELGRYVVHGLLHWLGEKDRTSRQQTRMRRREHQVLSACGLTGAHGHPHR